MSERFKRTKVKGEKGISRRGKKYEATVTVHGKTRSAGTHPTINLAKDAQARKKAELLARPRVTPKFSDATPFRAYASHWLKTRMAGAKPFKPSMERTVLSHLKTLNVEIGDIRLRDFSPERLRQIAPSIAPTKSAKYRKNLLQTMVAILEDAFKFGTLKQDVTVYFDYPTLTRKPIVAIPLADALKIVAAMRYPFNVAALIAALTGMRQGEVLALEWADILWDTHEIRVNKARDQATGQKVTPKTDAGIRSVAMPPSLEGLLIAYKAKRDIEKAAREERIIHLIARHGAQLEEHAKPYREWRRITMPHWDVYLFPARTRTIPKDADAAVTARRKARMPVLEARNLHREFDRARKAVAVSCRWHDLRHTFASHILATGGHGALTMLKNQLGHTDPAFTLRQYTHMIPGSAHGFLAPMDAQVSMGSDAFDLAQLLAPSGKKA